jgi:PKD repeat protein
VYADNLLKLGQAGCTITCDDLGYFEEPFFQDGPIAQAIATNFALGIPHFAATGNDYDNGIMGVFTPVNPNNSTDSGLRPPNGDDFHDWGVAGATPGFLPIDILPGRSLSPILQWNQPFQSYKLGAGASVDLNMYLFDAPSASANILAKSEAVQFGGGVPGGDPLEEFDSGNGYVNTTSSTQRVYLAINHFAGSRANTFFRIVIVDRTGFSFPLGGAGAISIYGHAASNQCIGVAAIYSAEIESGIGYGADSTHIHVEAFSSLGGSGSNGIPFFFDTAGRPLSAAPQRRNKPDISAVDGCTTTFFKSEFHALLGGNYYPPQSNHFPSFFGTSAAAPNAAAVAALLKERASLSTPAQLKNALQTTARLSVLNVPVTPPDRIGAGLIDAYAAMQTLPLVVTNPSDKIAAPFQSATFSVTASGAATLTFQWQKNGVTIPSATSAILTLASVQTGDDGSTYRCVVSNDDGTTASAAAVLHIDQAPTITSAPTANPTLVKTGNPVAFSIAANASFGQSVTITWTFGDGNTATGANGSNIFAAPGTYTVNVVAADPLGLTASASLTITAYADQNADGFPDLDPIVDNSGYADLAKTIQNLTPSVLTVSKLAITLNFGKPLTNDSIVLSATIPVSANFSAASQHVIVLIGGVGREVVLDQKGKATITPTGSIQLIANARTSTAKINFKVSKATLKNFFPASNLTDRTIRNDTQSVRVTIFANGAMFDKLQPQTYSATLGRIGKTK